MLAIIQARYNSERLPGKVLKVLSKETILNRTINRISKSRKVSSITVATSVHNFDDPIEVHAKTLGVEVFRGDLEDVGSRLLEAAKSQNSQNFIRISADSPFIDWRILDHAINIFDLSKPDLVTNIFPRTFPKGQSVEIINTDALARICNVKRSLEEKEHVTPYFYNHYQQFNLVSFTSGQDCSSSNHCIDTTEDFDLSEKLIDQHHVKDQSWQKLNQLIIEHKQLHFDAH